MKLKSVNLLADAYFIISNTTKHQFLLEFPSFSIKMNADLSLTVRPRIDKIARP